MAVETKKSDYPYVPAKAWWELRARFNQSWPATVNSDYLQSVLNVGEPHAQSLLSDLQHVGLVDADRRPTDLANDWRSDEHYKEVCQKILEDHYPDELRDAFPPPASDRNGIVRWFQRNLRIGEKAADKLASFYSLLARGNPAEQEKLARRAHSPASIEKTKAPKSVTPARKQAAKTGGANGAIRDEIAVELKPAVTVAVQVYISPETTPEQVDSIFASMAKHLGGGSQPS